MPYADSAATAHRWATERAVALWALFAGDLPPAGVEALVAGIDGVRADGGRLALVVPPGR